MSSIYRMQLSQNKEKDNLIYFMILRRYLKIRSKNLIRFFHQIKNFSDIAEMSEAQLIEILFSKQIKLDDYHKISSIKQLNPFNEFFIKYKKSIELCVKSDIEIFSALDQNVPKILNQIPQTSRDLIFIKGSFIENDLKSYSICGSRNPTSDAVTKTEKIAEYMGKEGFTLINGFAKGIDISAAKGAFSSNGRYIAVLGSGILNIYPSEHKEYEKKVLNNGAIISQRFPLERVNKTSLQLRNRLSATLALGSIFIEGNYKSGTKWQLKFAEKAKKVLFYLEPKNWNHENAEISKLVRDSGGIMIYNDLSNLSDINDLLNKEYEKVRDLYL